METINKKVLKIRPEHAGAHHNLALAYKEMGEFDKAIQSHENGISYEFWKRNSKRTRLYCQGNCEHIYNKISDYDLAISSSGASAIAELAFLNVPFVAIPFPFAKDDHQYFNAKFYESVNSCWLIRQDSLEINSFVDLIFNLFTEKKDYFNKKDNLEKICDENTWNNVNKKLLDLINEN